MSRRSKAGRIPSSIRFRAGKRISKVEFAGLGFPVWCNAVADEDGVRHLYQSSRRRRPFWTYASADSKLPCRISKQNMSKQVNRVVLKLGLVSAVADLIRANALLYCSSAN